ncbi:MAG TPA: hypothetical protein VFX45_01035 [Solirubrobacterales bacterium]|nr:hypothetical protein [Solirubrobacterales bacterium]
MLCALLGSAIAAQGASAVSGTTAFTCKAGAGDVGGKTYTTDHCKPSEAAGEFGHYKITEGTSTELAGNSNGEVAKLKATIAGAAVTFTSSSATGSGTMENKVDVSGEHYAHGEGTIVFNEITVSTPKCFAYTDEGGAKGAKGTVDTEKLTVTTKGQGGALKLTPATGEIFARFWVLDANKKTSAEGGECPIGSTYTITGSIKGVPDGATARMTHAESTAQGTLKLGTGAKVGIEGVVALEGRDSKIEGDTFKPLSVTTVETP